MLERDIVKDTLDSFRGAVTRGAKRGFRKQSASGKGGRSIKSTLDLFPNSFSLAFQMEDYVEYQDKGVSGTQKKYPTPYSYTNKRPPASAFDRWSVRRGIAPRDSAGRFLSRKSINFALANHIYKFGIKPKLFFTNAFEKEFSKLPDEVVDAYGLDMERFMIVTLDAKKV